MHAADVLKTYGDNRKVKKIVKKLKFTNYKEGVQNTVKWYKKIVIYFNITKYF